MKKQAKQFTDYLEYERALSVNTVSAVKSDLDQFLFFLKGASLSPKKLAAFSEYLFNRGYRASSISRKLSHVQQFCRHLYREGRIEFEAETYITVPKKEVYLPRILSANEMNLFLNAPGTTDRFPLRDKALLELAYACGLRISEIPALVLDSLQQTILNIHGKGNKERRVPVGSKARLALDAYLVSERPHLARPWSESTLFLSGRGKSLSRAAVHRIIQKYVKRAGLPAQITPHALRHTFATDLLNGGANLRLVQELLGHSNITTTERYTHVSNDRLKEHYHQFHPRGEHHD
jgi:site-specific recombinase XerD